MTFKSGASIATAVAFMLSAATMTGCGEETDDTEVASVKCEGINECAGMGECAGPNGENDCQGNNECAGMGWVTVDSEQECEDEGGTVIS